MITSNFNNININGVNEINKVNKVNTINKIVSTTPILYLSDDYPELSQNIKNFWATKVKKQKILLHLLSTWRNELIFIFRKNNTHLVMHSARRQDPIYRVHRMNYFIHKEIKQKIISTLSLSISAGRVGFIKNQKKSFIAGDTVISTALWFLKRYNKALAPVKFRLSGKTDDLSIHQKQLTKYFNVLPTNTFYSFEEATPLGYGIQKFKSMPRTRFRYHLYNFVAAVNRTKGMTDMIKLSC